MAEILQNSSFEKNQVGQLTIAVDSPKMMQISDSDKPNISNNETLIGAKLSLKIGNFFWNTR